MAPIIEFHNISKEYVLGGAVRRQETLSKENHRLIGRSNQSPCSAVGLGSIGSCEVGPASFQVSVIEDGF